jgi:protein-disulfide isomerase
MSRPVLALALVAACACTTPPPPKSAASDPGTSAAVAVTTATEVEEGAIPVTSADAVWGSPTAPVTLVMFGDFECRYCGDGARTVEALKEHYGPEKLRYTFKHLPLDIHERAYTIAVFAESLRARSGDPAFWGFYDRVFLKRADDEAPADAIGRALVDLGPAAARKSIGEQAASQGAAKVEADVALGDKLGIRGTPAFFVNGLPISGAQPRETFEEAIDAELRLAEDAAKEGVPANRIYAVRSAENRKAAEAAKRRKVLPPEPPEDLTVWYAPVVGSPVRGKNDALVTIVMFSDYECIFCAKVSKTLAEVEKKYGDDVRLVMKHNPLPFHKAAEPAAELALEVLAKKGPAAFWKAHDALFALGRAPDETDFEMIAESVGLDPASSLKAVKAKKHTKAIEADQLLASDLDAQGTPHFFVNGRRIIGARSLEEFSSTIDRELAAAKKLVDAGTPRAKVYDALMKDAKRAEEPPTIEIGAPPKGAPKRGHGPVVVQVFNDFQCPFCQRHAATLRALEKEMPDKITIVWRNLPLKGHARAWPAAAAALEVKKQKGEAAFWKMHDQIFLGQKEGSLETEALEDAAKDLGADIGKLRTALASGTHDAAIKADIQAAEKLGVEGTPGTFVDDYFVSGAVGSVKLKSVIKRALDRRANKK